MNLVVGILAKPIGQAGKIAHRPAHRKVLALDMGGRNVAFTVDALDTYFLYLWTPLGYSGQPGRGRCHKS